MRPLSFIHTAFQCAMPDTSKLSNVSLSNVCGYEPRSSGLLKVTTTTATTTAVHGGPDEALKK